jgi:hypothetical protein
MAIAGGAFLINRYGPEFSVLALILAEIILLLFLRSAYKDATKEFAY